jgi:hypothetical protein
MIHTLALDINDVSDTVNKMIVSDLSVYKSTPVSSLLTVKGPGATIYSNLDFILKGYPNYYSSVSLLLTSLPGALPDGVYTFAFTVDTDTIVINHYRTSALEKLLFAKLPNHFVCESDDAELLHKAYMYLRFIPHLAQINDLNNAKVLYNNARSIINSVSDKRISCYADYLNDCSVCDDGDIDDITTIVSSIPLPIISNPRIKIVTGAALTTSGVYSDTSYNGYNLIVDLDGVRSLDKETEYLDTVVNGGMQILIPFDTTTRFKITPNGLK